MERDPTTPPTIHTTHMRHTCRGRIIFVICQSLPVIFTVRPANAPTDFDGKKKLLRHYYHRIKSLNKQISIGYKKVQKQLGQYANLITSIHI